MSDLITNSLIDTERKVLGAMMSHDSTASIGLKLVHEDHFFDSKHRIILKTIQNVFEEKNAIDFDLTLSRLKLDGTLESAGGQKYIFDISHSAGTSVHFEGLCEDLEEVKKRRQILDLSKSLTIDLTQGAVASKILEKLKNKIRNIEECKSHAESAFRYLLDNNSEKALIEEMKNISSGVNTGFTIGDVNLKIPGGALSVVALPTGHGKTTLLINCSLGVLKHHYDKNVYFFSYEENQTSILSYFINTWIGKNLSKNNRESIRDYFLSGSTEYFSLDMRDEFIRGKKSFFNNLIDTGRLRVFYTDMAVEELINSIRFIKKNTNVGLICIDYVQCLRLSKQYQGSRQEQLKEISYMLKDLAVETGLPILLGAQFNREVLCEADISPTRIREAADIEQIANLLIGGWNRNYNGFSREGNRGKDNKPIPVEPAIFLEIMKGRGIGNGHNSVLEFHGNIGKVTNRLNDSMDEKKVTKVGKL